jgi:hypothetical protein
MNMFRKRPSPALIISVAALIFALVGTAIAAPATISALTKKDKKAVKKIARKIADQRIRAKARNLSVKSAARATTADTATSATTAATATTATTATTAGNVSNQLWAIVNADGTLFRGSQGIVSSVRDSAGQYVVTADRSLANCFFQATLGGNTPDAGLTGDISVNPVSANPNQLYVRTGDNTNVNSDRAFTTLIRC